MSGAQLLEALRARGEPVPLADLAARLVAAPQPLAPGLARRIVAVALGRPAPSLPDPLPADALHPPAAAGPDPTPLERAAFAVVDLETTGLSPRRATIIEIGAVRILSLRLAERFETLVDPRQPLPRAITALTGIHDAMLAGAPPLGDALRSFRRWLAVSPGAPLVAHNAPFDEGFLRRGFAACGLPDLGVPILCTRKLARRLVPELRRFGLERLAGALGVRNRARHRALGDAEATAEALLHLLERARTVHALRSVGDLRGLQERPPPPRSRGR